GGRGQGGRGLAAALRDHRRRPPRRNRLAGVLVTARRRAAVWGVAATVAYLTGAAVSGHLSPFARRPLLDGTGPPPPYNWVSPPPDLSGGNQPPTPGAFTLDLNPQTGTEADVLSTQDVQVSLAVGTGAIAAVPGQTRV